MIWLYILALGLMLLFLSACYAVVKLRKRAKRNSDLEQWMGTNDL